jgi:hypothetical protein
MNCQGSSHAWGELRSDSPRDVRCDCGAISFEEYFEIGSARALHETIADANFIEKALTEKLKQQTEVCEKTRKDLQQAREDYALLDQRVKRALRELNP